MAGFCGIMLQKPLAAAKPAHAWPDTQWQDMQNTSLTGPREPMSNHLSDQGAAAIKLAGSATAKPKFRIKIGGKQVALPKAATPPPSAPLPEFVNKIDALVKKTKKLLKKPLQPLPEALLRIPEPLPRNMGRPGTNGNHTPAALRQSSPLQAQPKPALQARHQGPLEQDGGEHIPAARAAHAPEPSQAEQARTDAEAPMDFHQWLLASKLAEEGQRGPEQDVGRPKSAAAQEAAAPSGSSQQLGAAAALSPEACDPEPTTPPNQDPPSPAGSCNDVQQAVPLEKPSGPPALSVGEVAEPTEAAGTSAAVQHAAPSIQQQQPAVSGEGASAEAKAGSKPAHAQSEGGPQVADAAVAAAPAAAGGAAAQLLGKSLPAGSGSRDDSSSSSSSSDDSSSSSESSSSDSDTSSSDHSSSLSGMPLLPGGPKRSSPSKDSLSGGKRAAQEVCGPSPKRQKPAPAGEVAMDRLDSVREDGEIKGERGLQDALEARERERGSRRTPEAELRYPRGSSRDGRDRQRPHAQDSERRRDDEDHRLRRRSDEYYKMHNWKYSSRQRSKERTDGRQAEDNCRRRDRTLDRGLSIEEERRQRGIERERERQREKERQEERRRREVRQRGSGCQSYDYSRRSRSRDRSASRRAPARTRTRSQSRAADERRRERDRSRTGRRTRSPSRERPRQSERRSRDTSQERRRDRQSAEQERTGRRSSPAAPSQARKPEPAAPSEAMAPASGPNADKAAGFVQQASAALPPEAPPLPVDKPAVAPKTGNAPLETPSHAAPATISSHQAQLSERKPASRQKGQASTPAATAVAAGTDPSSDLSDAARAFALALRASIESQAQEGGESSADLRKQVASRKRLAKMFVEKGLEYERQLEALVAAGAEPEECARQLRDMCSATTEGVILTLKAQVHFLRWAALGERMISQGRGAEWAAAVQDSAALAAKGVQPKHVLANEYQAFVGELQQRDAKQLYAVVKARFQRAAAINPSEKALLSKGLQFIELARLFAMRLEMVAAVRTNAFQAPSLKQHEAGLRSVEDAHRQAQRHARQHPPPQPQLQQRGALRGQQPSPRAFPGAAAAAAGKPPADAGESFQRPSPGDSNNSETTASTPPTAQGLQQYMAAAVPAGAPGLPPLQAGAKGDASAYVIPQHLARSQDVLLNSHRRFMTAHELGASREIQLMLLTMMEDDNAVTARAAALVSAMGLDAALMDVMAVPTLGRQCVEGLRALRDSLGLTPAQGAA